MAKIRHEVRDAIHGFIHFNNLEKQLIDSEPFQRLRSIHQLAMSYQIYPGATHKRFEHSLGVMDVASRIFDTIFEKRLDDNVHAQLEEELDRKEYWRNVVRLAALLHDVGHLPFSHAAENLLPDKWNHERLTAEIIRHSEVEQILKSNKGSIDPEDVIDVACDIKGRTGYEKNLALGSWKTMLNEIITGDTFGADRIDYLLRDGWHAGVPYGRFDSALLIDGLRAVTNPDNGEVTIGLDIGAIHAAEALLLARYFMYNQVYFHKSRRVYNIHLREFLLAWLGQDGFSTDWHRLMALTDDEVLQQIRAANLDPDNEHHELAARLLGRQHFRTAFRLLPPHIQKRPTFFEEISAYAIEKYGGAEGEENRVRIDHESPSSDPSNFLVVTSANAVEHSSAMSQVAERTTLEEIGLIFVHPSIKTQAKADIENRVKKMLS